MQEYDAKQVEANAKLAGFTEFEHAQDTFKDPKSGKEFKTIGVKFIRPIRNPSKTEIEVEVKTTTVTKGGDTKTTTTTTASVKGGKGTATNGKVEVQANTNKKK